MKPVTVSLDLPVAREDVFEFLDVMANHESFTDHMLLDWEYSGPPRGVGSRARVHTKTAGKTDVVDIEVVAAEAPAKIVEQNIGAKGRRQGTGTYLLEELPSGGTRVTFEYSWQKAPSSERLMAPLARSILRKGNTRALERLAEQLADGARAGRPELVDSQA
jgi:hypothetical protein